MSWGSYQRRQCILTSERASRLVSRLFSRAYLSKRFHTLTQRRRSRKWTTSASFLPPLRSGLAAKTEAELTDSTIVPLQIWDTPSHFDVDQLQVPLNNFSTIVYVMDMQQDDSYHEAILPFIRVMIRAHLANPNIKFAVFIHKAEVLSEDYRGGKMIYQQTCQRL